MYRKLEKNIVRDIFRGMRQKNVCEKRVTETWQDFVQKKM